MAARAFTLAVEGGALAGEMREGEMREDRTRGDAPCLVFVHGFGGDRHTWDAVWQHLPPALPALRYDQRGFGGSTQDESQEFSHADDLLALLDAQGIACATLIGLSQGGAIAAHLAIHHPERIAALVLVAPALTGWEWSDDWRLRWRAMVKAARSGDIAEARRLWWQHPLFDPCRDGPAGEALHREIETFAGRQWLRDPQRAVLPDVEHLHTIAAPTLLLTGGLDLPDFQLIADLLTASVPGIRRIDYPDAGHMLPLERPAEVAAAIAGFVGGNP